MTDRALIGWQVCAVALMATGWGYWLWRIVGRTVRPRRCDWFWWGLGGFIAHALVLQTLAYLDLPLRRTAWVALAVGIAGCAGLMRQRRGAARAASRGCAEFGWMVAVVGLVLAMQLALPLSIGPARFFGHGRYDQANYVVTAQFLQDERFSTDVRAIGLRPWLVQPVEKKEERITQSVVHGAIAAVSGGDAQKAYAATVAVFLTLAAGATFAWLRNLAVPPSLAALAGMLVALAPGATRIALDGFFSQIATLFVLPALAGTLWPRAPLHAGRRLMAGLLLAFVLGAYTEIAAVSIGATAALVAVQTTPAARRIRDFLVIVGGALVLNPGYTLRLPAFLALQFTRASDPHHLASYFPDAGSWAGLGRIVLDFADARLAAVVGVAMALFALVAVGCQPRRRRTGLLALVATPLLTLVALLLKSPLPAYPFAKLLITFTPLWVGLAAVACAAVLRLERRAAVPVKAAFAFTAIASAGTACSQYKPIFAPRETLAALQSDGMARVRTEVREHPERNYLVTHDDPLVAQWLCYFGRNAQVYLDRRHIGDRVVTTSVYAFRRLPSAQTELWSLDPGQPLRLTPHEASVTAQLRGALETGETDRSPFYVVGAASEVVLRRDADSPARREVWLDVAITPLSTASGCTVELSPLAGGRRQAAAVRPGGGWLRFRIELPSGQSRFAVRIRAEVSSATGPLAVLQAISVEPVNRHIVASDPVPAPFID